MDRINILHIYQNSKIGGIQQQLINLLNAYDKDVFNPIFCCLSPLHEIGQEMQRSGVETIALNRKRYHKVSPGIVMDLYRIMKEKNIHVVRTHKYRSNLYGRIAAWLAGVPVVVASVHGNYRTDKRFEHKIVNKLLYHVTDRIIAVSESIREDIIKFDNLDPSKIMVFRNGVNLERFCDKGRSKTILRELSLPDDAMILGFIGRLVINKGVGYLLDAFHKVKQKNKNIKLLLVGDGVLMDELKAKAQRSGLSEDVIFTGSRRDIVDILSTIDVFVMPSIAEGLPNALLEAMAVGKPIVASAVGGIPEVIKDEVTGMLVRPGDAEALAEALNKAIDDREIAEKMGLEARKLVQSNYSIDATARRWESLYRSLLMEKGFFDAAV
jgi:sugar transferase (PEP-CTERM/EpsH1 system associated)